MTTAALPERQPGQVSKAESPPPKQPKKQALNSVISINCEEKDDLKRESASAFVRISTRDCLPLNTSRTQITNLTNGYEATVFAVKKSEFTSDLIRLQPGTNQILVVQKASDQKEFRRVVTLTGNF